jgi:SAM-dependent methyltransferase
MPGDNMTERIVEFGSNGDPPEPDGRLNSSAFHRNHQPIWTVLAGFLDGRSGCVLELGSGTGQHVVAFAGRAPEVVWWPSDCDQTHVRSINAWRAHAQLGNIRQPLRIDVSEPDWGLPRAGAPTEFIAILCINVLHISPWRVAQGLLAGAGRHLRRDGRLFVYGPFMRDGKHTAPSNAAFDQSLRSQDAEWGVRDMGDLGRVAQTAGLTLAEAVSMPANNFVLVFKSRVDRAKAD